MRIKTIVGVCVLLSMAVTAVGGDGVLRRSGPTAFKRVLGDWEMETDFRGNAIEATMSLTLEDGRLVGVWKSQGMEMEITDVKLEGNTLSFKRSLPNGPSLNYQGAIDGDKITGKYTGGFGELKSTGVRKQRPQPAGRATTGGASVLDGQEKSFVVVGYSTSFAWPAMLQDMLDEHAGGKRLYHVLNAVVGGSPVKPWISEPGTERYKATIGAMRRDYFGPKARLRGEAPAPTVALCQQSLQFTRTQKGPIPSITDTEGLRIGADALEKLAFRLRDFGIKKVLIGMHIFKEGYEPEVGNERFALKALLQRGHDFIFEGPDVWSLTISEHPGAFTEDRLHPNERGMKIMAEAWYRTLAGSTVRPEVIERMHARKYEIEKMMRAYIASRRDKPPAAEKRGARLAPRMDRGPRPERTDDIVTVGYKVGDDVRAGPADGKQGARLDPRKFRGLLGPKSKKIRRENGKTFVWAAGKVKGPDSKWYDFTGAPMPASDLQYGIGKDRIRSIDDPLFVDPGDPRLLNLPQSPYRRGSRLKRTDDIMVIGYAVGDDVRAYPVALLDHHELVNDWVGGKPVAVGW